MRRLGVKGSIVNMGSTVGVHDIDCNLEDPSYQVRCCFVARSVCTLSLLLPVISLSIVASLTF